MKILKFTFILCFFCLFSYTSSVFAFDIGYEQTTDDAGLPGEYLSNFGANARALGMGKAYTAVANDSSGPYWNPAGIARMTWKEASFLYASLFKGTKYSFVGYAHPFAERNVLGISWIRTGMTDIDKRDDFGESVGTFSDVENAYLISYARKLNPNLDAGVNIKIISQDIDVYSAIGYGIDVGALYRPFDKLSLGLNIQNALQPKIKLKDETDVFPINLKFGLAYKMFSDKLLLVTDVNYLNLMPDKDLYDTGTGKSLMRWHAGLEYIYSTELADVAVRAGIDYKEIACGFGVKTRYFTFDYAVGLHTLEITHRLGVTARFGMLPTEEEKLIARKRREVDIKEHYQLALKSFNEKNFDTAISEAKKVVEIDPQNEEAQDLLDTIYFSMRKQEAVMRFEKALEYFEKGEDKLGKEEMQKALELDPEIKEKLEKEHFARAQEHMSTRDYKDAEKELIKTLRINSDNEEAKELLQKIREILEFIE